MSDYIINFFKTKTKYTLTTQIVEEDRINILAYNSNNPKIAFFGHMDTVLPKNETTDPFIPRIEGDKLYGLGSVDMKSGLSIMMSIAEKFQNDDLAFIFSVDEEYDFKGANKLIEITDLHPEYILNVEPSNNKILNGCRGITEISIDCIGKSAHAGRKQLGINAIEKALELTKLLEKDAITFDTEDSKTSINLAYLTGGLLDSMDGDTPIVKRMGNIVPDFARIVIEYRLGSASLTENYILSKINEYGNTLGLQIKNIKTKFYFGSMLTPKADLESFEKAIKDCDQEIIYADINQTGYFELQILQNKWGGKCFVYGAGPNEMAHAANEYVSLKSLSDAQAVIEKFISNNIKI